MEKDVEVEEDMEEEDEEEVEDVDVEELEDAHGAGKAPQPNGEGEPGTSPPLGTGCLPGSPPPVPGQPGGTEASLRALVSRLRTELGQREAKSQALAARLAREERRHRRREEDSMRQAQLRAREAEALRETNAFLGQALAAAVAAGGPGALARAQEEAQGWREAAEERGARLAEALAETAALASRLRDCQAAAAGRTDTLEDAGAPDEVAAVEEVLRRALELARGPQEPLPDPQVEGEPSTATSMAMVRASLRGPHGGARGRGARAEPPLFYSAWPPWLLRHGRRPGRAGSSSRPSGRRWRGCRSSSAGQAGTPHSHHPPPHSGCPPSPPAPGFPLGPPMMPHLDPGEQHLGMGRGREGRIWGGRAGGRHQFGD